MFSFFKRKSIQHIEGHHLLPISTDMHSHVLPGIDDGSPDIETSLQLLKGIYNLGIRKMIATPHIIADLYRNTPETINAALEKLKPAVAEAGIDIEISAAAEYMLDDYFLKILRSGQQLLTIHNNIVLTEQSYATPTGNLNEISFELISSGYQPIMAHPERYGFYHKDYDEYIHLKDMGFSLQVNLLSLTGYYGKPASRAAKFILENGLADYVGTDMHHQRHLSMLSSEANLSLFQEYIPAGKYNNFL